jgi:NADP-dependent 3-hydroxy acid dehydrogenase YdfG
MKTLRDKVVVITGAAGGIGSELARAFARAGSRLALVDVDETGLRRVASGLGVLCSTHVADVSDREAMQALPNAVLKRHGAVHVLVNNAGVSLSESVEHTDFDDLDWVMGINFHGVVHGCVFFLPHLKAATGGAHIVNISSLFGLIGVPSQSIYCASKFAVAGYTESLRAELHESNIGVTCVHPGLIQTDILKHGRFKDGVDGRDYQATLDTFQRAAETTPAEVATQVVKAVKNNDSRVLVGKEAHALAALQRLMPSQYLAWMRRYTQRLG